MARTSLETAVCSDTLDATRLETGSTRTNILGVTVLDQSAALGRFLADVERRAFRIAAIAVRNDADAFDLVQDAMLQLARHYSQSPAAEWRPIFHRILQNRIRDHQRRRKVRDKFFAWLPSHREEEDDFDPIENAPSLDQAAPDRLIQDENMRVLEHALRQLPARQQQAFMLRNFEGLDVADTARAMGCSEGSVKTHYSRAVHALRDAIGELS